MKKTCWRVRDVQPQKITFYDDIWKVSTPSMRCGGACPKHSLYLASMIFFFSFSLLYHKFCISPVKNSNRPCNLFFLHIWFMPNWLLLKKNNLSNYKYFLISPHRDFLSFQIWFLFFWLFFFRIIFNLVFYTFIIFEFFPIKIYLLSPVFLAFASFFINIFHKKLKIYRDTPKFMTIITSFKD